jgi:hypothetical protein
LTQDHLENLSEREKAAIQGAIEMLDAGEGPAALEATVSQWALKAKILELQTLAGEREAARRAAARAWGGEQAAARLARARERNRVALLRWEADKRAQVEKAETRLMEWEDKVPVRSAPATLFARTGIPFRYETVAVQCLPFPPSFYESQSKTKKLKQNHNNKNKNKTSRD